MVIGPFTRSRLLGTLALVVVCSGSAIAVTVASGSANPSSDPSLLAPVPQGQHLSHLSPEVRAARAGWIQAHRAELAREGAAGRSQATKSASRAIAVTAHRPIAKELRAHFALLRSARSRARASSGPALPLAAASALAAGGRVQVNLSQAQYVPTGGGTWIVPGTNGACVVTTTVSVCNTTDQAETGTLLAADAPAHSDYPTTITGLTPDGNTSITITLVSGATQTVPVSENTYSVSAPDGIRSVSMKSASGSPSSLDLGF